MMRLKRLELENFKGVGARQAIDLKPITLLFGPNSAGKSTILQALHYVREILERGNLNADKILAGGLVDLGGFQSLIHNHDLGRSIIIRLEFDTSDEQSLDHIPFHGSNNVHLASFSFELTVSWSKDHKGPYLSRLEVEMNGARIGAISSPPAEGRAQIVDLNFDHPILAAISYDFSGLDYDELNYASVEGDLADIHGRSFEEQIGELSREVVIQKQALEPAEYRVGVVTDFAALPFLDRLLECDLIEIDDAEVLDQYPHYSRGERAKIFQAEALRRKALQKFLDDCLVGPLRTGRDYLAELTYIGPLREIPQRSFRPSLSPDGTRWATGLAAWDLLYSDASGKLLEATNDWLDGDEKLNSGFRLNSVEYKEIPLHGRFSAIFDRGATEEDLGELQEIYSELESRSDIALIDGRTNVRVTPSDIGIGISQMLPVVVACLSDRKGLLSIEQPELHIHPALQVGLGDLLIHATRNDELQFGDPKSILIETHSEHILLRLLRRIRETTDGELPPGVKGLSPDDLSVVYVETTADSVNFRSLRVDSEGEFIDRWPHGFFEERAEELF